jgi:hypothetical protein
MIRASSPHGQDQVRGVRLRDVLNLPSNKERLDFVDNRP